MLSEFWIAILLSLPLIAMLLPSVRYWKAFRKDEKEKTDSRKANYNTPFFLLFVSGIGFMWVFWISGVAFSFLNLYYAVFNIIIFAFEFAIYIQLAGLVWFYIGGIGYNWVLIVAGKYVRPAPSGALENHRLITTGPFRIVRHPLYLSYACILLGLALVLLNFWLMIPLLCVIVGVYPTAKAEEEVLLDQFGEAYVKYQEKVGMLFPRRARREP